MPSVCLAHSLGFIIDDVVNKTYWYIREDQKRLLQLMPEQFPAPKNGYGQCYFMSSLYASVLDITTCYRKGPVRILAWPNWVVCS